MASALVMSIFWICIGTLASLLVQMAKESACKVGAQVWSWVGKLHWRRVPALVLSPGEFHEEGNPKHYRDINREYSHRRRISKCSLMPQSFGYSSVKAKVQVMAFYAAFILTNRQKSKPSLRFSHLILTFLHWLPLDWILA